MPKTPQISALPGMTPLGFHEPTQTAEIADALLDALLTADQDKITELHRITFLNLIPESYEDFRSDFTNAVDKALRGEQR